MMMRISKLRCWLLLVLLLVYQNLSSLIFVVADDDNTTTEVELDGEDEYEEIGDYLNSIRDAVQLWQTDRSEAIKLHGPIEEWNLTGVTKMHSAFEDTVDFTADLSAWDVSSVTSMSGIFRNSTNFHAIGLNKWNTSSLLKLSWAFENSTGFNSDISNWDVSRVTSMYSTFEESKGFSGGNITHTWDTSGVVDFFRAFYNTSDWFHTTLCWDLSAARKGTSCNSLSLDFCEMMIHPNCPYTSCIAETAEIEIKSGQGEFQLAANFCAIEKEQITGSDGRPGGGGDGDGGNNGIPAAHPEALQGTEKFENNNPQSTAGEGTTTLLNSGSGTSSSSPSSWRRSSGAGILVILSLLMMIN